MYLSLPSAVVPFDADAADDDTLLANETCIFPPQWRVCPNATLQFWSNEPGNGSYAPTFTKQSFQCRICRLAPHELGLRLSRRWAISFLFRFCLPFTDWFAIYMRFFVSFDFYYHSCLPFSPLSFSNRFALGRVHFLLCVISRVSFASPTTPSTFAVFIPISIEFAHVRCLLSPNSSDCSRHLIAIATHGVVVAMIDSFVFSVHCVESVTGPRCRREWSSPKYGLHRRRCHGIVYLAKSFLDCVVRRGFYRIDNKRWNAKRE